jgi:hypothetical protein
VIHRPTPFTLPLAAAVALAVAAGLPESALAQGEAAEIGKNLGEMLSAWAGALFLGVLALVAIPPLARRDVSGGVVLTLLAVVLGGFVFFQSGVDDLITSIWQETGAGR